MRRGKQHGDAFTVAVEHVTFVLNRGKVRQNAGQGLIGSGRWNGALPVEDLPQAHKALKTSRRIRAQQWILDFTRCFRYVQKPVDSVIRKIGRLGEDRILRTVGVKGARQPIYGRCLEWDLSAPVQIAERHKNLEWFVFD